MAAIVEVIQLLEIRVILILLLIIIIMTMTMIRIIVVIIQLPIRRKVLMIIIMEDGSRRFWTVSDGVIARFQILFGGLVPLTNLSSTSALSLHTKCS